MSIVTSNGNSAIRHLATRSTCSQLNITYNDDLCGNKNQYDSAFFQGSTKETFKNARAYCKRSGGDLASFSSANEFTTAVNSIKNLLGTAIFIGLRYYHSWVDGSYSYYRNFQSEEYDNQRLCAIFYDNDDVTHAKWHYSDCQEEQWFLCKGLYYNMFSNLLDISSV